MFSKHYQEELAFLRASGREFAKANPATAGLLAERGGDPDVERLLEGFAFLTARIRERLDDAVPEVIQDLAEILLPHYLRPLPAATVVEFTAIPGALRARAKVKAGVELASAPIDGTACRFRTTADLEVVPAAVVDASLDLSRGASPAIRLVMQAQGSAAGAVYSREGVRLFLHGELPLASTALLWFARHLQGVSAGLAGRVPVALPLSCVKVVGLDPGSTLLPWPALAPAGYQPLQEYFTLPEKFLFLELGGLDAVAGAGGERVELTFRFDRPPELPGRVTKELFRFNCVPAVNLFMATAEPLALAADGEERLVRAAEVPPQHMEVFEVARAHGAPAGPGARVEYPPFTGFRHAAPGAEGRYYRLRRRLSPLDGGLDTFLSISRRGAEEGATVLSLDLLATNRDLAARVGLGALSQQTSSSPTTLRFRNLLPVTVPVRPPIGTELHWRLIAHLAANRGGLQDAGALRRLLSIYNLQGLAGQQQGGANQLKLEGLREVEHQRSRRLVDGAPARGTRTHLALEEGAFAGPGDAFLFGNAVAELLASQVGIGSFVELSARLEPSRRGYDWPARNGRRAVL